MDRPLLIIFTRNPVKGKVKTRLAAAMGDDFALALYHKLRNHTHKVSLESGADIAVYYSDFLPDNDCFIGQGTNVFLQNGSDLGMRMLHAFKKGFSSDYRRIALIGTDCFELDGKTLKQAFALLHTHQAVIGPATDGGYYLIGLRVLFPDLFINRQWSTPDVCREAVAVLRSHDVTPAFLPQLPDIDTVEDLANVSPELL